MRICPACCLALALAFSRPLAAQPAEALPQLPPLQVSAPAQRLPEAPEDLPSSISEVSGQALHEGQYGLQLSESLVRVPGLVVNDRHNHAQDLQIVLRGFGARASFGLRGIRLYTDGIPATMPDGQGQVSHFDLTSAETVRVLRGPFSALYGSSSGGVIELTSRTPQHALLEAHAATAAHGMQRYSLLGGDASSDANWLGAASHFRTEGYRAHSAARRSGLHGRLGVNAGRNRVLFLGNAVDIEAEDPLGLTREDLRSNPRQATANAHRYNTRKTVRQAQLGSAWSRQLGDGQSLRLVSWLGQRAVRQFLAIPDFVQGTAETNPTHSGGVIDLDRAYYGIDMRWEQPTRLSQGQLDWTLGLNLEAMAERRQGFQNFIGDPGPDSSKGVQGPKRRDEDNAVASLDPYAQADWRFAPAWSALAGLRYSHTRFTSDDRYIREGNGDDSGNASFDALLPMLGLRYAPRPGHALHAAWSRGSETPTANELAYRPDGSAGLNDRLRPARSSNWELGARLGGDAYRAELAVFRTDTTNEIVVANSENGRTTYGNATATRRDGLELALTGHLHPAIELAFTYTWIDARYRRSFCTEQACEDDAIAQRGNQLPAVPRQSAYAELRWQDARRRYLAALETRYRSALFVDDLNGDAAGSANVVNLRLVRRVAGANSDWEWYLRADNLLDRAYVGSVIVNERNGRYFEPAPDRSLGAGLRWNGRL